MIGVFDNLILYKLDRKINAQTIDGDLHNPNLKFYQHCAADPYAWKQSALLIEIEIDVSENLGKAAGLSTSPLITPLQLVFDL